MKKLLFLGAMAAMLLGTASCSDDMETALSSDGTVSFKVELPGNFESRSISDGTTATKLEVACYNANGEILADLQPTVKTDFVNREATVTYKLVKGQTYNFAFFAHADGAPYTFTPGANMAGCKFDVNYTGACNDEKRDAFYAVLKDYKVTTAETTVTLYRPFAQLNFGADDLAAAKAAGIIPSQSKVTISKAATTFGLFTETATGEAAVEYTLANLPDATTVDGAMTPAILKVEDKNYDWMEMCYFLVPGDQANVDVEMTVKTNGDNVVVPVANVPVQKNHRTNIVGSLFTQDANFRIIIDQNFDNYDYDIVNGQLMLKAGMTTDEINKLIASGFGSFALAEDLVITKAIKVPSGITATLNLNGHNITNDVDFYSPQNGYAMISVLGGNLTINGQGQVKAKENDAYALDVWNGGNLVVNGGDYNGNITAVYVYEGSATINNGTFTIQQLSDYNDYRYMLNLYDANGRNGTASITVNGGKYYQFDPGNNLAEGPNTNFLGEGYEAVQDGDWYKVQQIPALSDPDAIAAAAAIPGKYVNVAPGIEVTINLNNVAEGVTINGNGAKLILNQSNNKVNSKNVTIKNFTIDNTQSGTSSISVNAGGFLMKDCAFEPSAGHEFGIYMGKLSEEGVYNYDGVVFDAPRDFRLIGVECKGTINISNSMLKSNGYPISSYYQNGDCDINVSNTQLIGWTSFNTGTNHTYNFDNCYFGKLQYGYFRPYGGNGTNVLYMNNCTFSNDYDGVDPIQGMTINANGCKWENGTAIDASLFNIRSGSTIYIDGVLVE